jgi:hypothetical protein
VHHACRERGTTRWGWRRGDGVDVRIRFQEVRRAGYATPQQTAKLQCSRDENVKGYVVAAWGHYTSLDNNLFPNNASDEDNPFKVKAEALSVRFMGRTLNDVVGRRIRSRHAHVLRQGVRRIHTVCGRTVSRVVAPLAAVSNTPRTRAFRLAVAPKIMLGGVDQDDFCNTSACNVVPRQFSAKYETLWSTTVEVDILTLIAGTDSSHSPAV